MGRDRDRPKGEAHIRMSLALLNSPAYIALDWTARALFTDLRSRLRGTNNGNVSAALTELRHRGWRSPATLAKSLRQLEAVGLIAKTRQTVGVHNGSKYCNLYRFTDLDSFEFPKLQVQAVRATHDYKQFTALGDALRAIAEASPPQKKRTLQNPYRDATKSIPIDRFDATESVEAPISPTTENVAMRRLGGTGKPSIYAGLQGMGGP